MAGVGAELGLTWWWQGWGQIALAIIKNNNKAKPDSSPHSRKSVLIPKFWPSNDNQPEIIRTGSFTLTTSPSEAVRAKLTSVSRGPLEPDWSYCGHGTRSLLCALGIRESLSPGNAEPQDRSQRQKNGVSQQQLLSAAWGSENCVLQGLRRTVVERTPSVGAWTFPTMNSNRQKVNFPVWDFKLLSGFFFSSEDSLVGKIKKNSPKIKPPYGNN